MKRFSFLLNALIERNLAHMKYDFSVFGLARGLFTILGCDFDVVPKPGPFLITDMEA